LRDFRKVRAPSADSWRLFVRAPPTLIEGMNLIPFRSSFRHQQRGIIPFRRLGEIRIQAEQFPVTNLHSNREKRRAAHAAFIRAQLSWATHFPGRCCDTVTALCRLTDARGLPNHPRISTDPTVTSDLVHSPSFAQSWSRPRWSAQANSLRH
jgi:hypothetical protein